MSLADGEILIVEDESDSMEVVQGILDYHGIRSVGASTAKEALRLMEEMTPSLLIIDLALPDMDGWRLLETLRDRYDLSSIKCVAMTAYHNSALPTQAINAGFDAYFAKPVDAAVFVDELQRLVDAG
ncbi:MAG: response regulator [Chloroflexi bacterium]|nr:response regulator [Chloroflexota bacterium]